MRRLAALWRGELPLAAAFWDWAVIGGLLVNISTSLAFYALILHGQAIPAFVIGYVCSVPYNILATVGVWRAAGRFEGPPAWATAARGVTVVLMAVLSLT